MLILLQNKNFDNFACDAKVIPYYRNRRLNIKERKKLIPETCYFLEEIECGRAAAFESMDNICQYYVFSKCPVYYYWGDFDKKKLLQSYVSCLSVAKEKGCSNIAIPLILGSGESYPKDIAFRTAVKAINDFLKSNDLNVYLFIKDKSDCQISTASYERISRYLDKNFDYGRMVMSFALSKEILKCIKGNDIDEISEIERLLSRVEDSFAVSLFKLIDLKNMSDVECYKSANVSRQTWYKILNEKDYKPSRNTVLCFAIALKLTYKETQKLLSTVGYSLSNSSKFDLIIKYYLENGVYDLLKINQTLFAFGLPCLGS